MTDTNETEPVTWDKSYPLSMTPRRTANRHSSAQGSKPGKQTDSEVMSAAYGSVVGRTCEKIILSRFSSDRSRNRKPDSKLMLGLAEKFTAVLGELHDHQRLELTDITDPFTRDIVAKFKKSNSNRIRAKANGDLPENNHKLLVRPERLKVSAGYLSLATLNDYGEPGNRKLRSLLRLERDIFGWEDDTSLLDQFKKHFENHPRNVDLAALDVRHLIEGSLCLARAILEPPEIFCGHQIITNMHLRNQDTGQLRNQFDAIIITANGRGKIESTQNILNLFNSLAPYGYGVIDVKYRGRMGEAHLGRLKRRDLVHLEQQLAAAIVGYTASEDSVPFPFPENWITYEPGGSRPSRTHVINVGSPWERKRMLGLLQYKIDQRQVPDDHLVSAQIVVKVLEASLKHPKNGLPTDPFEEIAGLRKKWINQIKQNAPIDQLPLFSQ